MKKIIKITLIFTLLYNTYFAQLDMEAFTIKENYQYGEVIELYCKITNSADTTFEFLAGNYQSCQAEFSFNDFKSWEHTICLPAFELLTFKPHSSKIYKWIIDPQKVSLPDKNGIQKIICKYYFDLKDTVLINSPKFIGGEVNTSFHKDNLDSIQTIFNLLNAKSISADYFGDIYSEVLQIEGYDIDSLIQIYSKDSIFVSFEKSNLIGYEKIYDENPIDYYPLQVGNKWFYEQIELENINDSMNNFIVTDTFFIEVKYDTIMPNGKKYSVLNQEFGPGKYVRSDYHGVYYYNNFDSTDALIYDYSVKINQEYNIHHSTLGIAELINGEKYFLNGDSLNALTYRVDGLVFFNLTFVEGFGPINYYNNGIPLFYKYIGGYINGNLYGDTTVVGINDNLTNIPTVISLSQNYPNPFNPTTNIEYSIPQSFLPNSTQNLNNSKYPKQILDDNIKVSLKVYDVLGKEIKTLVNEIQKPGNYNIQFNGADLPSGVYFYQLKYGIFSQTKKMLILK